MKRHSTLHKWHPELSSLHPPPNHRSESPNADNESLLEKYIALKTAFSASGVYADKHLYFADEKGKTFVVKPGPELEIVATNQLDDGCMASPALNEKAIYLRTKSHVYRIEKK
ncbi:hypothetical protein OAL12_03490 [Akkermansiaceae bacterium]|nr:hypothetical protein [Akkermansiaceae bacterium]